MTVAAKPPFIEYLEDGVSLQFPVPFRFLPSTLRVRRFVPGLAPVVVTGWTATPGSTDSGGTVTLSTSIAGARLRIERYTPRSQSTDYQTNDRFPAETHELALDRDMLIEQEQDAALASLDARALRVPEGETVRELPAAELRADKLLGFDGAGQPIVIEPGDLINLFGTGIVDFGTNADASDPEVDFGEDAIELVPETLNTVDFGD